MRIRWTLTATGDLTQISDYIETHGSGSAARGVALSIHDAIGFTREISNARPGGSYCQHS